jgi:hypothetical protein
MGRMNEYYSPARPSLPRLLCREAVLLSDEGRETARLTTDFNLPDPDALVLVTERMHYYLLREKGADGTAGR